MNNVTLMGRLTKDPEVRYSGETAVARYTLAVDRDYKGKNGKDVDFINVTAFSKTGEFVEKYFTKGMKQALVGRINVESYKDKEGNNRTSTGVIAEKVYFCESKGESKGKSDEIEVKIPEGGFVQADEELPFQF